jgi:hypothetical protein
MRTIDRLALPFDQYQRYTIAAEISDQLREHLGLPHLCVLDAGGYYHTRLGQDILPLVHFLPGDQVFALDLVAAALPNYAQGSGLSLPFGNKAFDLVVSCDTLEHIAPAHRLTFVDELLRVARHLLLLIAPFDSEATRAAEQTWHEYMISRGSHHKQLQEHIRLGLPEAGSLRAALAERNLNAVDLPDGYLPHWLAMMLIKHTSGQPVEFQLDLDRYYNRHLATGDRREPSYRRVFVVALPGNEELLPLIAARYRAPNAGMPARQALTDSGLGFATELIPLLEQIERWTVDGLSRAAALEAENACLRQLIAGYERGYFVRTMRWLHSQRKHLPGRLKGD